MFSNRDYVLQLQIAMLQKGDVKQYEKKIAERIKTYVDVDSFYQLPINNILNVVKQADFEDVDNGVDILCNLIHRVSDKYQDQAILLLNVIPDVFTDEQIPKILSGFKNCPLLAHYMRSQIEKEGFPVVDYQYRINEANKRSEEIIEKIDPFQAADEGRLDVLKAKIKQGFNANTLDEKQRTLLHHAAVNGQINVMQYLIDELHCRVDPLDRDGKTPLMKATKKGQLQAVQLLYMRGANLNAKSNEQWYPIHCAAKWGHVNLLAFFVQHGVPVDLQEEKYKRTPFFCACERDNLEAARYLLQVGADINAQNINGYSPLHTAAHRNLVRIVQFLLLNHANINILSNYGQTPLDSAYYRKQSQSITLIQNAGGIRRKGPIQQIYSNIYELV